MEKLPLLWWERIYPVKYELFETSNLKCIQQGTWNMLT